MNKSVLAAIAMSAIATGYGIGAVTAADMPTDRSGVVVNPLTGAQTPYKIVSTRVMASPKNGCKFEMYEIARWTKKEGKGMWSDKTKLIPDAMMVGSLPPALAADVIASQ